MQSNILKIFFKQNVFSLIHSHYLRLRDSGCNEYDIDLCSLFKKSSKNHGEEMTWPYKIDKYLSDLQATRQENILERQKRHESVFTKLSLMAKKFLATPAISASVERQFSRIALTITKSRNRLNHKSIRSLNSWLTDGDIKKCLNF